jgi:hypothetical protein
VSIRLIKDFWNIRLDTLVLPHKIFGMCGTSGNGNGNGQGRSVALDGGHTHQGCTDAIGKMCLNPP